MDTLGGSEASKAMRENRFAAAACPRGKNRITKAAVYRTPGGTLRLTGLTFRYYGAIVGVSLEILMRQCKKVARSVSNESNMPNERFRPRATVAR